MNRQFEILHHSYRYNCPSGENFEVKERKYHTQKNFLSKYYCNYLIDLFKKNEKDYQTHRTTTYINLDNYLEFDPVKKLFAIISKHGIDNLDKNCFINYMQVVEWKPESYQPKHYDFNHHPYTSIIYLNDDFDGGETVVGNEKVKPEMGKILSFNGSKILHEVLKINSGVRYTVPVWYKSFEIE